jgi:hypothetical protein
MKSLFLTAVAALGFASATLAQVPNYVPTNGLVGWWPFNGNANDESGNGNNGTVNGAILTSDRFGNANGAYSFDGVSSFISTNYPGILGTETRSIAFWARQSQANTSSNSQIVLGWGGNLCGPAGIATGFYCAFNIGVPNTNGISIDANESGATYNTPIPVSDNNWHHYIFIKDQNSTSTSSIKIYQDGMLMSQQIGSYFPNATINTISNTPLIFGKRTFTCSSDRFYEGQSDDIGIWNRALTQEEITNLYNGNICFETVTVTDTLLINMGIVGYNPITYSNTIKIFPNPSNDHITIDYGDFASVNGYQLRIDNSLGQQMFQSAINQQTSYISLSTWTGNGLYFVHIIDPQGNTIDIRKIVLQ